MLTVVAGAILFFAPDVFLVVFAGILLGVFLSWGGSGFARRTGIGDRWGIGLFLLSCVLAFGAVLIAFAPAVTDQVDRLAQELPAAVERLRERVGEYAWGDDLLRRATPETLMSNAAAGTAATAVAGTFGALGNAVVIFIIGIYVALDPDTYRRGFLRLLAPSMRDAGEDVLRKATASLRKWLIAQLIAMGVVGVLTWLGLWLLGIPLAMILGVLAALLTFIPNLGPVIAAVPAILLGLSDGYASASMVAGVYVVVQTLESYVITPLIQQQEASLPPALVISMQVLMGVMFGLLGLALATPLAAVAMTLVRETYVTRYLERESVEAGDVRALATDRAVAGGG